MAATVEVRRIEAGRASDWMPEAASAAYLWSGLFRATEPESGTTVGEALLARTRLGSRVLIRVSEAWRDSGAQAALMEAVVETAKRRGDRALLGWRPVRRESSEAEQWLKLGFQPANLRMLVEVTAEDAVASCKRQMARLAGRTPADARVIPLRDAPLSQVVRLKSLAFGGKPAEMARRVRGEGPGSFEPGLSFAVMAGGTVAGIALGTKRGEETFFGEAIAIDPRYRGGWALPLLKGVWLCAAFDAGMRRFQGEIAIENAVSRKVFRRDGVREVALLCDFVREIEAGEAESAQPTALVSSAPPFDPNPLVEKLRGLGWEDAPGTDAGRLRSLPGRVDWWRETAGRLVQMPCVLLNGLPSTGTFRVLMVVPEGKEALRRGVADRAAARLRLRSNCEVMAVGEADLDADTPEALMRISQFLCGSSRNE